MLESLKDNFVRVTTERPKRGGEILGHYVEQAVRVALEHAVVSHSRAMAASQMIVTTGLKNGFRLELGEGGQVYAKKDSRYVAEYDGLCQVGSLPVVIETKTGHLNGWAQNTNLRRIAEPVCEYFGTNALGVILVVYPSRCRDIDWKIGLMKRGINVLELPMNFGWTA